MTIELEQKTLFDMVKWGCALFLSAAGPRGLLFRLSDGDGL